MEGEGCGVCFTLYFCDGYLCPCEVLSFEVGEGAVCGNAYRFPFLLCSYGEGATNTVEDGFWNGAVSNGFLEDGHGVVGFEGVFEGA